LGKYGNLKTQTPQKENPQKRGLEPFWGSLKEYRGPFLTQIFLPENGPLKKKAWGFGEKPQKGGPPQKNLGTREFPLGKG